MYVGERQVNAAQFEQAIPHLQEAVRIAPLSDKAVLLLAKAALKSGDTEIAAKALNGHDDGKFEDGNDADFLEVKTLWERALGALKTAKQAVDLEQQDGKGVEAAKLMHQAAAQYPESKGLASQLNYFDQGAAFSEKNYDRFLALAQQAYDKEPNGMNKAAIASAWACKYAVSGNAEFRQNAEQILEQAQQMVKGDAEQEKAMEEFLPRLRYRLDTRVIVGPQEYNKRFRSGEKGKK